MRKGLPVLVLLLAFAPAPGAAAEIRVAVAANFSNAAKKLAERFRQTESQQLVLAFGSTGKHYAQIKHGAPFDVFLAADAQRPALLEQQGLAVAGSRFTYAIGRLVLWSPKDNLVDRAGDVLHGDAFRYLAIANPRLAPYGRAAQQVLEELALWDGLQRRLVRGENISQTFQFVKSGNAELAFVAFSQVTLGREAFKGSRWFVPQTLYTPIEQQAVLLVDTPTARRFIAFLAGDEAREIIQRHGYRTP